MLDCENCEHGHEPVYESQLNYEALNAWRRLDLFGRDIDTFSGVSRPLKLEAIEIEANGYTDPEGLKWRIMLFEERVYSKRLKRWQAEVGKKGK